MQQLELFTFLVLGSALLFLLLGFYRPYLVLWWEDVQNRRKVLRVYGTIVLITGTVYLLLRLLNPAG